MDINVFDEEKNTPLHYAILNKDEKTAFLLLDCRAFFNRQNVFGQTPLMLAAERGLKKIVAILIKRRADVGLKDRQGNTALFYYRKFKDQMIKKKFDNNLKIRQ